MYRKRNIIILIVLSFVLMLTVSSSAWADKVDERISNLNATLQAEGLPWTAGRTSVSDLLPSSFIYNLALTKLMNPH